MRGRSFPSNVVREFEPPSHPGYPRQEEKKSGAMRSAVLTLLVVAIISSLSSIEARARQPANIAPSSSEYQSIIGETDLARPRKSLDNERRVKRLQTGSDAKVQKIYFDSEEDKPGIRVYGLPRRRLQDNGIIERVHVTEDWIGDGPRIARLVEAYGMPKDKLPTNGFIERLPLGAAANRQPARLGSNEEIDVRSKRSVGEGAVNKVEENVASEAEDMQAQDSKVFRPLFVYRQQQAKRQKRKKHLMHRYHQHASHHYCSH